MTKFYPIRNLLNPALFISFSVNPVSTTDDVTKSCQITAVEGAAPDVEPTGDPEPESAVEAARRLTRATEFNDSFHDSIECDESVPAVEGTGPMVETVDSPGNAAPSLVAAKDGSASLVDSASNGVDSSNAGGSPSLVATDSNNNCTTIHGETATTAATTTHGLFNKKEEKALLALLKDYDPKAADDTAQNKSKKARKLHLELARHCRRRRRRRLAPVV